MRIVATAGHVDHGKSTLVRALTGMEPDRFQEERDRGLTLDLGFTWTVLHETGADPLAVAFVDVPGHERFVTNMVAGAAVVTDAMFVVAADQGWCAQSTEHLEILDLLGVRAAAIVVTRAALADADRRESVAEEVRARVAGTSLAGAPMLTTDAPTGLGLDRLRGVLADRLRARPGPAASGRGRLWVDRSFTVHGAGTVVTGSWWGTTLAIGDDVVVLPSGEVGRIRGLQALGRSVDRVATGSRVALNLAGIPHERIGRGDAVVPVAAADGWRPTTSVLAHVRVLVGREVGARGAWTVHVGSAHVPARVVPLAGVIPSAGTGPVRLELDRPVAVRHGDRFVLRESGRRATVAGGVVLDPHPPARRRGARARRELVTRLVRVHTSTGDALVRGLVDLHGGVRDHHEVAAAVGRPDLAGVEGLEVLGSSTVRTPRLEAWARQVVDRVVAAEATGGVEVGDAVAAIDGSCPSSLRRQVVDHLVGAGRVMRRGTTLVPPDRVDEHDREHARHLDEIVAALAADPTRPPGADRLQQDLGATVADLQQVVATGRAIRLDGLLFATTVVDDAVAMLVRAGLVGQPFTAAKARTALGTSRKFAIPLLEHLAATGRTTFDGQHHRLAGDA